METATIAGGCFWCIEAIFKRLKGVESVMPGYVDGAETVDITFDPTIISFEKLLTVFFHLHDPTTVNRQGNDVGPQYRSAIFYHNEAQKKAAEKAKNDIPNAVTEITKFTNFYPAEEYHRDYYAKNRSQPYCRFVIDPKIAKLMGEFAADLKPTIQ